MKMPQNFYKISIPVITIAVLLLMVLWMAGGFDEVMAAGLRDSSAEGAGSQAESVLVQEREQPIFEICPASIEAKHAAIISSRILAGIEKIHVRAGDMVKKGQLLIELEKGDLQSRVSQLEANHQAVQARFTEATLTLKRAIDLTARGAMAQADMDTSQAKHDALQADLASAQFALKEAQIAVTFTQVLAPMNGRVVDRFAEPGDTAQPGVKLLSLYNPLSLRVEAHVREHLALSLSIGQKLNLRIPALQHDLISEIEERVPAGHNGSRSFLIKSRLQESQDLLPGMYAQLKIPAGTKTMLIIPHSYVASVGQLDVVWIREDDIVERRFVRIGRSFTDGNCEVVSGLNKGDVVLARP